jgi:diguanylate cyclase (GGDEF)-like protein/PAS domain S-box-containing protein
MSGSSEGVPHTAARPGFFAGFTILAVDNQPLLLQAWKTLLSQHGYQVDVCAGDEAIERLGQQRFDLLLLALSLPQVDSRQVIDFIAASQTKTAVVVIGNDSCKKTAIAALKSGAYSFLREPFEQEELLSAVKNALDRKLLEREHVNTCRQLQQSETWYRYLVNSSPDLIYTLDQEGCFTFVNEKAEALLGCRPEELIGLHYSAIVHDEDIPRVNYVFNERRTGDRASRNVELRLKRRDGKPDSAVVESCFLTAELNATGIYEGCEPEFLGKFLGTYGVAKDISERKKAEQTIHYQAYHDLLTGLPNRMLFKDRLTLAIAQAKRNSQMLAVMFLDLDRFKMVNDTLGHVVGDELLLHVSSRLRGCLREGDTLARMGGDEFTLLLPQISFREDAVKTAQKILAALQRPFHIGEHELFASVSIGISLFPNDGEAIDSLVKNADIAMYHAKAHGRSNYQFYSHTMNATFSERLSLENAMRRALERREFTVFYQPQVSVESGAITGMEALIRWQHPTRGLLPPSEFIPLAEETGLIVPIGEWVLRTACAQAGAWREMGLPLARLAVNLSGAQIEQPDSIENIMQILQESGLPASALEIEITESVIMKDVENTIAKLVMLSACGVKIGIDDFGTGYSSLSYLKKFPIHTLKIDQSFVHDISRDPSGTSIVTAIIAMAKGLKLNIVAEGVETQKQLSFLRALECDEMQGFLFSWPLTAEEATRVLSAEQARLTQTSAA